VDERLDRACHRHSLAVVEVGRSPHSWGWPVDALGPLRG
jgi:hypothetical protein